MAQPRINTIAHSRHVTSRPSHNNGRQTIFLERPVRIHQHSQHSIQNNHRLRNHRGLIRYTRNFKALHLRITPHFNSRMNIHPTLIASFTGRTRRHTSHTVQLNNQRRSINIRRRPRTDKQLDTDVHSKTYSLNSSQHYHTAPTHMQWTPTPTQLQLHQVHTHRQTYDTQSTTSPQTSTTNPLTQPPQSTNHPP